MTRNWLTADEMRDELAYLASLAKDRTLDWAQVSGPCLRRLLACEKMQRVLDETEKLGVESPLRTATAFREAKQSKDDALPDAEAAP